MREATAPPATLSYSLGEEVANAVTHGVGSVLSAAGLALLLAYAGLFGDAWHVVSVAIYGTTLVLLYTSSTLYHGLTHPGAKRVMKVLDHVAIYLLIAGSYTPYTLVTLRGPWGWSLFGVVWGLAVVGVVAESWWVNRPKWLSALVYLGMGWMVVVAARPLLEALPRGAAVLILAGGVAYTAGTLFYVNKRIRYMHAVWHGCVLAGSVCHYLAVLLYVVPGPS
jgi:hemolysin III